MSNDALNTKSLMTIPYSDDLEQAVLGSLLIDSIGIEDCFEIILSPDVFFKENHRLIFIAISELYTLGSSIDLITVSEQLKKNKSLAQAGGDLYLMSLTQKISSSAHIEYHSRLLVQYFIRRSVIRMNHEVTSMAYDDSVDSLELMGNYQTLFDKLSDTVITGRKTMSFPEALRDLKQRVEFISGSDDEHKLVGVDTGFKKLNKFTGGYREQDLVIVAARPGMGKTAYVLKTVVENAKNNQAVGFISLEMSMYQLTARIVAIDTNFHMGQLVKTGFEKPEYFNTYSHHENRMKDYPIFIDDSGSSDISQLVLKTKQWKRKHDIKLLVVDYLQLMTDRNSKGNRESEINSISRRLKQLAKELNIPIVALSQLSRAVETRGSSKRPMLSDLRDSGAIEQDADIVQFLYRPAYYGIEMIDDDYEDPKHKRSISFGANTEVIFAKYRGGSLGTALLKWIGDKTKFVDPDDEKESVDNTSFDYAESMPIATPKQAFDIDDSPF